MNACFSFRADSLMSWQAPPILLGSICNHLSKDRDLQQQLREDLSLVPAAVEEFIRLYSPYRGFARTVAKETIIHGRTIQPGVPITLTYSAANRDPEVFEEPDEFILNRSNITAHLGFGRGRHRCIGMPLARSAIQIALSGRWFEADHGPGSELIAFAVLLENTSSFEVVGPLSYGRMPELGLTSCPLKMVPR